MNKTQSDTARSMNADFLAEIARAVQLANQLDDLGEPFPIISDVPRFALQEVVAAMEVSLNEIEECETLAGKGEA